MAIFELMQHFFNKDLLKSLYYILAYDFSSMCQNSSDTCSFLLFKDEGNGTFMSDVWKWK